MSDYIRDPSHTGSALSYPLGALTAQSDFESIARQAADASPSNFLVVFVSGSGSTRTKTYATSSALLADWDNNIINKLGSNDAFALYVNKTAPIDYRFDYTVNPRIETLTISKIDWKNLAPWAIGGAIVIAAAVFLTRNGGAKKKAPAKRRRRAGGGWRRRTVTVWR